MKPAPLKKIQWAKRMFSITMELLNKIKPHQIYCAGDFADPHGTHKVCLDVVIEALTTN